MFAQVSTPWTGVGHESAVRYECWIPASSHVVPVPHPPDSIAFHPGYRFVPVSPPPYRSPEEAKRSPGIARRSPGATPQGLRDSDLPPISQVPQADAGNGQDEQVDTQTDGADEGHGPDA